MNLYDVWDYLDGDSKNYFQCVTTCSLLRISFVSEIPFASISSIEDNAPTHQPTKRLPGLSFFCQLAAPQLGIFIILYALIVNVLWDSMWMSDTHTHTHTHSCRIKANSHIAFRSHAAPIPFPSHSVPLRI